MTVCLQTAWAQVSVPQLPSDKGPASSEDYTVTVRPLRGGEWQQVSVLRCDVNTRRVQRAAYAEFDMGEPVVVRVTSCQQGAAGAAAATSGVRIRPTSRGLVPAVVDSKTIELTLQRPEYLSIEFQDDRHHNLHLFANAMHEAPAMPQDERVINWEGQFSQDVFVRDARFIYFGPGVHRPKDLPGEEIKIPSNCTVYLAPGAVVKARLIVDHAENVRIVGRGIVDHPLRGVEITYSKHVVVDGLTFLNPAHYTIYGGQSSDITVRNIKSFSARSWSDGIDLMCCSDVLVENCFLRTSDDCIALYNHRWWYWGGSNNIEVRHCVFWPDVAHSVNIGTHGDDRNPEGETLSGVRIHDCDVLYGDDESLLAVNCGDRNHIRDISFEDIRVEGAVRGALFDLRVLYSEKYNRAPGCCIDNVTFSRITVDEPSVAVLSPGRLLHYDTSHGVSNVRFHDIRLGNRPFDRERDMTEVSPEVRVAPPLP